MLNKLASPLALKIERLLLRSTNGVIPHRRFHFKDPQFRIGLKVGNVLRRDEDELTMTHLHCDSHEIFHGNLSCDRVKENVEFVHYAEGRFEAFANRKEEGQGGKAPLTSAQGLDVLRLAMCISVALK